MSFATNLKKLKSLDLFAENEYPWSINLFELDLITRHIPSPTVFIHYLKGRLTAQEENVFLSLDELSFLGWYLERGNFYIPLVEGGRTPKCVQLNSFCMPFDDHYLFGKKTPELKIEPDYIKIIRILEDLHQFGFSDIASSLLDFNHQKRKFILKYINELIEKTKKDRKKHDFSTISDELDMGFTFMTQYERNGLRERLGTYCTLKKYKTKIKKWIGIGRWISDNEWFVNEFIYLDFPWKMDREIEKLLEDYPFIKKFT